MSNKGPVKIIAFQGVPGAYSHLACSEAFPELETLPCQTFEAAFGAVSEGRANLAMIPIENSVAGRVADIHRLMPDSGLYIIGEHFQPVNHYLVAPPGATLSGLKEVHSHAQALGQCRRLIQELGLEAIVEIDTAGAALQVAKSGDLTKSALASELAAKLNKMEILKHAGATVTRFLILSRTRVEPDINQGKMITTFVFTVRNVSGALYKAMGGFATNGINMVKLESYMLEGSFLATQFYGDIEGHPSEENLKLAFEELEFFTSTTKILGVYPAHPYRLENKI